MEELPTGVLTFFFTDMDGSTRLLARIGANGTHSCSASRLLEDVVGRCGGRVVDDEGDGIFAVFGRARDAVGAASDAHEALATHAWSDGEAPRVRIGLHTGEAEPPDRGRRRRCDCRGDRRAGGRPLNAV